MFSLEQEMLVNLKLQNTIKDSDTMEFYTPFNQYKFIINRYDSEINFEYGNRYIIETEIYNNLGTLLTKSRMNESGILALLDNMNVFLNNYDFRKETNSINCNFGIELDFSSDIIRLVRTDASFRLNEYVDILPQIFDEANQEIREINFDIIKYSPIYKTPVNIVSFKLSDTEFKNLMFAYFFVSLIDIDLIPQDESKVDNILRKSFYNMQD